MNTTASVPAWKRLGLKVKNESDNTEISVEHLESAEVTKKQIKRLNQRKRTSDKVPDDAKKPPKRQKLPKDQKKPPPEKDQLAYLRQYHSDRSNWKFSKQKQNWILKNIETIPSSYEKALQVYIEGLQGGSRERVISELQNILQKWNNYYEKVNASINEEIEERKVNSSEEKEHNTIKKDQPTDENGEQTKQVEDKEVPNHSFAKRCATLLHVIGEEITAKGIDISNEDIDSSLITENHVDDSNEVESSDSSDPPVLLVESVEVNGIGESSRHVEIREKIQKERNSAVNSQVIDDKVLSEPKDEVNFDDITESDEPADAKSGSKDITDESEKEIDISEDNKTEKHIRKRKRRDSSESIDRSTSYEIDEPNAKSPQAGKQKLKKDKEHKKDKDQRKKSKKVKKESRKSKKVKKESKKTKEEGKKD